MVSVLSSSCGNSGSDSSYGLSTVSAERHKGTSSPALTTRSAFLISRSVYCTSTGMTPAHRLLARESPLQGASATRSVTLATQMSWSLPPAPYWASTGKQIAFALCIEISVAKLRVTVFGDHTPQQDEDLTIHGTGWQSIRVAVKRTGTIKMLGITFDLLGRQHTQAAATIVRLVRDSAIYLLNLST